jgi:hypothetical protein
MIRQLSLLSVCVFVASLAISPVRAKAEDPAKPAVPAAPVVPVAPETPATPVSPGTVETSSSPAVTSSTPSTPAKLMASGVLVGKVTKVSESSITLSVVEQVVVPGKHTGGHMVAGHMVGGHVEQHGWFKNMVPPHWVGPHMAGGHTTQQVRNVTHTLTFDINPIPPVKIDAADPATRKTGSYSDVKVGEMVRLGLKPTKETTDGKSTTHTIVTGIDVLTPVPTTAEKPKK